MLLGLLFSAVIWKVGGYIILLTEPADSGTEMVLKLWLSWTCMDVKLPVCIKDTIGMAKKKLQVSKFMFKA
jgi:hypothetical protein